MGFKDLFVGDNTGNYSSKVKYTGCNCVTIVKIPQGKTVEKWSKSTSAVSTMLQIHVYENGSKIFGVGIVIGYLPILLFTNFL